MRVLLFLVAICGCVCLFAQEGLTADQESRIQQLEKVVKQQQQRIEDLQQQVGETKSESKEYTDKLVQEYLNKSNADETPVQVGYDKGFFISSADKNFKMKITGYMNAGVGFFETNSTDNNGVFVNGFRLDFDFWIYQDFHARLTTDVVGARDFQGDGIFNSGTTEWQPRLRDGYVEYTPCKEFGVKIGQFFVPFSFEGQLGENQFITIFQEPFVKSWNPGRDPGIMISGTFEDTIEYKFSAHNGEGINKPNQTDEMLFAGQFRCYYLGKTENPESYFQVSALRGRDDRLHKDDTFGAASILTPWGRHIYGDSGILQENGAATQGWHTGADAGGRLQISGLRLEGEFMFNEWQRKFSTGSITRLYGWGAYGAAQYLINLDDSDPNSGFYPTVSVSYTDVDNYGTSHSNGQIKGQTLLTYTFGLGYAFNKWVRVNFNWVMIDAYRPDVDGPKTGPDTSGALENAWLTQVTFQW